MEVKGARPTFARVPKTGSYSGYVVCRLFDKGRYEGANESAVNERILKNHDWGRGKPCALIFGNASTNRCLSTDDTGSGETNPLMDDPQHRIDST